MQEGKKLKKREGRRDVERRTVHSDVQVSRAGGPVSNLCFAIQNGTDVMLVIPLFDKSLRYGPTQHQVTATSKRVHGNIAGAMPVALISFFVCCFCVSLLSKIHTQAWAKLSRVHPSQRKDGLEGLSPLPFCGQSDENAPSLR